MPAVIVLSVLATGQVTARPGQRGGVGGVERCGRATGAPRRSRGPGVAGGADLAANVGPAGPPAGGGVRHLEPGFPRPRSPGAGGAQRQDRRRVHLLGARGVATGGSVRTAGGRGDEAAGKGEGGRGLVFVGLVLIDGVFFVTSFFLCTAG